MLLRFVLLAAVFLVGCGGPAHPDDGSSSGAAPTVTASQLAPSASFSPTPSPEPVVTPVMQHPGAAELGFTAPLMSRRLAEVRSLRGTYLVEVIDGEKTVTVTNTSLSGETVWTRTVTKPTPEAVAQLSSDDGLKVVSVWFTTAASVAEDPDGSHPLLGSITWFELETGRSGAIVPATAGGEPRGHWMLIGYYFHHVDEAGVVAEDSPWFVHLDEHFRPQRVDMADLAPGYDIYGSWSGKYWGVVDNDEDRAIYGEDKRLMAYAGRLVFWGGVDYFRIRTGAGVVQLRDHDFETVLATGRGCAEGTSFYVGDEFVVAAEMIVEIATKDVRCVGDQLPDGTQLHAAAPDGWVLLQDRAATLEAEEAHEAPTASMVGRLDSQQWRPLPAGTTVYFEDDHALFVGDLPDGGEVVTVYPISQFAPAAGSAGTEVLPTTQSASPTPR